jgi:predicted transposase YdaD
MKEQIDRARPRLDSLQLWTATYVLMGLRYSEELTNQLLREVGAMEESVTYQAIVRKGMQEGMREGMREGREEEARKLILLQGRNRFGKVSMRVADALDAIQDVERLEELSLKLLEVSSWQELLGLQRSSSRPRSRKQPKP